MHQQTTQQHAVTVSVSPPPIAGSPTYWTVAQFADRHPAFTVGALRMLIFAAQPRESSKGTIPGNGLIEAGAIVRIGRKVLIREDRFFAWVEAQQTRRVTPAAKL